jgi:hypothetical protein
MVRSGSKRSLRLASICSDDVMKGAGGRWVRGVDATDVTAPSAPGSASAIDVADALAQTWTFALASS